MIYTKGATEIMLELSTKYINSKDKEVALDAATRSQINASISKMTKGALRYVALAHRSLDRITGQEAAEDLERGLTLDASSALRTL